jgi:hypothetical protein
MNRLIAYLREKDTLSIAALRATYHRLVMRTHPDVSVGSAEVFVRLQAEYEEAAKYVLSSLGKEARSSRTRTPPADRRAELLGHLYLYSIRFPTRRSRAVLSRAIEIAAGYDARVSDLLKDYEDSFVRTYRTWKDEGQVARLHESFLTSIKQLACYYQNRNENGKRLLCSVFDNLTSSARKLDRAKAETIRGLCTWLRREADKEKVFMFDTIDAVVT